MVVLKAPRGCCHICWMPGVTTDSSVTLHLKPATTAAAPHSTRSYCARSNAAVWLKVRVFQADTTVLDKVRKIGRT